jgi:hypothetical protein
MLQTRPHAIHFKRILDFGEGQPSKSTCPIWASREALLPDFRHPQVLKCHHRRPEFKSAIRICSELALPVSVCSAWHPECTCAARA